MYLTNFQWKLFRFITSFNLYRHLLAVAFQKYGFWRAKRGFLRCKKWVFTLQKGGFYTPKTPFLFFVSITNTLLMCYEYSVKWLRTFHEIGCEHSVNWLRTPRNVQRNILLWLLRTANCTIYVRYNAVFVGHKNRRSAEHFRISTLLHNAFYKKILGKLCHNLACGVPQES